MVLHVRPGVRVPGADTPAGVHREADGEPVADVRAPLGRAHGLQRPHQGLPGLPQLPRTDHVQVNQGNKADPRFFFFCTVTHACTLGARGRLKITVTHTLHCV